MSDLISLDGVEIEYKITGHGEYTIIFLNGGGADFEMSWSKIVPNISDLGVSLQYNLPGIGESSKPTSPQTGKRVISTLKELLHKLKLPPPYLLVGHSLGGLYANLFARLHPDQTKGVVFVDSAHPDQFEKLKASETLYIRLLFWGIRTFAKNSATAQAFNIHREIKSAGSFPKIPITVLTGMKHEGPRWVVKPAMLDQKLVLQKDLAHLSSISKHVISHELGHDIANSAPDLVIQSIGDIASR